MSYKDPTPRILAAGSVLAGLVYVMLEPAPSVAGVLVGLGSVVVSAGCAAIPQRKPAPRKKAVAHPRPEKQDAPVAVRRQQPDRPPRLKAAEAASRLPEIPTHRHRIRERQVFDQY